MTDPSGPAPHTPQDPAATGGQGRTLIVGGGIAVVILLVLVAVLARQDGSEEPAVPTVLDGTGQASPGFALPDAVAALPEATLGGFAGGEAVAISDLLGGPPLVLNFWATWCAPCVAEMPDLQELHEAGGGAFRMVGINTQDAAINAEDFVAELGITYGQTTDIDGSYFNATGSFGMPTTLFVHPDGDVAYRQTGPLTLEQMQDLLAEHLGVDVAATGA